MNTNMERNGMKLLPFLIGSLFGLNSMNAYADDAKDTQKVTNKLEEIQVVTGTKTPVPLAQTPVRTLVVSKQEIEAKHAQNLADVLSDVPGLRLTSPTGNYTGGKGVQMQGFDSNRVLILIDGSPVTPSSETTVDLTQISVGDIERVEVVKGATSALYGTSAMGGVINVITKNPPHKLKAKVDVSGGNWGNESKPDNPLAHKNANIELSTKQGKWSGQVIADLNQSSSFRPDASSPITYGYDGHKNNFSGKYTYDFDSGLKLSLMPRIYDEDAKNVQKSSGNYYTYHSLTDTKTLNSILEQPMKNGKGWKLQGMWEDFHNNSTTTVKRETKTNHGELGFQYDWAIHSSHLLTMGVKANYEKMDRNNLTKKNKEVDNKTKDSQELFAQDSWFVTPNFEVIPGVRAEKDSKFGDHVSPSINTLYSRTDWLPGRLNFRASVGNGYRTPSLKELYYYFDQTFYKVIGNENLKPESSTNYQLGAEWIFLQDGSLEVNLYHNDIDNLIDTVQVGSSTTYQYENIERTRTQGVETVFRKHLTSAVNFNLSYTYLDAVDLRTNKKLTDRPEHQAKMGVDVNLMKNTVFSTQMNYQSDHYNNSSNTTKSPGYATWDFRLNHEVNRDWSVYAGVNNAFDEQRTFSDTNDFRPEEGRYVYVGAKWQLVNP
ncbi:TonB-dependent receptor plug domain-containing protein [Hydrogenovibrio marinus]|uniref:TonB-dependent receptor plug domain-containing protein n=3 Tax=Hydrogenovibrio marinus TaxID=28885 RepID=UPI0004A72915|nr:TonB-dependent receptor [Hydrogenovibrio marinus]BBN58643.1 TonB-dependent receptor [Hydrogenovibrio marinus]